MKEIQMKRIATVAFILIFNTLPVHIVAQDNHYDLLIAKMQTYEEDIKNTYSEYQKVYYERKSSQSELIAFEDIISVYVSQILEIYDTISLTNPTLIGKARDVAARSLIYRALTYLEKAPLNIRFYEKACYDYYRALSMYKDINELPIILRTLPSPLVINNIEYKRLYDLIAYKGEKLFAFGKVQITLKNFKVTTNLNANDFEFIRTSAPEGNPRFTYYEANELIKESFNKILIQNSDVIFLLALPEGSYAIRNKREKNPLYASLATIHVRANQQHNYIAEPLLDWIIVYEDPQTSRPQLTLTSLQGSSNTNGGNGSSENKSSIMIWNRDDESNINQKLKSKVDEVLNAQMQIIDISKIFNLKDPWIQSRFLNLAVDTMVKALLDSEFYNSWDNWMLAWKISGEITNTYSPGKVVPAELIHLIKNSIDEL